MTQAQLAKRVETLEKELADVKKRLEGAPVSPQRKTSRDFIGMFRNDRYFKEAMELGTAYRRSSRSGAAKKRAKKK